MLTPAQIARLYPRAPLPARDALARARAPLAAAGLLERAGRLHFFLAQLGHESAGLTVSEENLSYSAPRLMAVWPSRFGERERAEAFARAPEKLAEAVYGGRMGNTRPGDGWRYRGRGYIQLTGRDNYRAVGRIAGLDIEAEPDLACRPDHAVALAAAYWTWRGINRACDDGDFAACTRAVNGGLVGLEDRRAWLARAQAAVPWPFEPERLKAMQRALKARGLYPGPVDGLVGRLTRAGLRAFQEAAGLPATGQPDAATLERLGPIDIHRAGRFSSPSPSMGEG